jgi:DNA invertase Pin-like site-specific DNA recombinase
MRVLGYGRVSTDKDEQEASLPNQEQAVRSFCAERTDDGEYGGQHDLVEWYDEQVSGTVPLMDRDTFPKLIDHLNNDETIDGILVKNFKRLGRDVIDQITIKRDLERVHVGREIEVFQLDPWDGQRRSMMDPRTKNLLQADDPRSEMNKALVFIFDGIFASEKSIATSMATSRGMQQKAERDEPIGNLRWGIITDKMYYEDVSEATERLPHPEEFPTQLCTLASAVE